MLTIRKHLTIDKKTCGDELSKGFENRTNRTIVYFFLLPSLIVTIGSYFSDHSLLIQNSEIKYNLFSRAGSIVVIFFAVVEFRLYRHIARYERVMSTSPLIHIKNTPLTPEQICQYCEKYLSKTFFYRCILALGGLTGTLIWGYGDLLFL